LSGVSVQFGSEIVIIPREKGRNARMPDPQLIIAVGFAIFNVYLFAFQMPYGSELDREARTHPLCVSLVVGHAPSMEFWGAEEGLRLVGL